MLDQLILQITLFVAAIILIPAIIIVIIQWLVDGEITCYDDDTLSKPSDEESYLHTDLYGRISGFSDVSKDGAEHYSGRGYSASFRSGNDTYHYGTDGYHGRSHRDSDTGEITHYNKDNMPCGYSRPNDRGGFDHFDQWNLPVGSSRKD